MLKKKKSNPIELQLTADGSHTLFVPELDEHYHSVNGAIQEAMHVFINAGLRQIEKKEITIFEVGFGTGLNAYLTLLEALSDSDLNITYYSVERYPLELNLIKQLNYAYTQSELFIRMHEAMWDSQVRITENFSLFKLYGDSNTIKFPEGIDLVYFDAFGPDKQPEVWNQDVFNSLYEKSNPCGLLTTYCAKGAVRRMMKEAGYSVERIPGPPGKREMLRASKILDHGL